MKKVLRLVVIGMAFAGLFTGTFLATEYLVGIRRLKYATIKLQTVDNPQPITLEE